MSLKYQIQETEVLKTITSEEYNSVFNKELLTTIRWGKTKEDNPIWAPFGPEYIVVDIQDMSMEMYTILLDVLNANRTITIVNLLNVVADKHSAHILHTFAQDLIPISERDLENPEEAGLFSLYVNNKGIVKPVSECSEGIDILSVDNFYVDIWQSPLFKKHRWELLQRRQ